MELIIHRNGSFDIIGESCALKGAYPSIDGTPVRPLSVTKNGEEVRYELENGMLTLSFSPMDDAAEDIRNASEIEVFASTEGPFAVHDIGILANASVENCTKGFCQGLGMCGPSGFRDLSTVDAYDSDAVTAVGSDSECLVLYVPDVHRFRSRFEYRNGKLSALVDAEHTLSDGDILPILYITSAENFDAGLRYAAGQIAGMMMARKVTTPAFHWCSWYYLYHTLDQETLERYLNGFTQYRERFPFTHIQIDAGYFPSCGDWLKPYSRFPKGLKFAADTIKAAGYEPGIWIGPFMVGDESTIAKEHEDWLLHKKDGSPVLGWVHYNEPKPWGYRDSHYYVLDTSHPDAMAYIRGVFRTLRSWGYTLFKTDFMLWGIQDSSEVLRHTPGKTSFEYYREFMTAIREEIGEDTRWLGCIAPFMPMVGFADMMRVAGDVGAQWDEGDFGPVNMINELVADQYFNNVYWQNDPDAVMLRDFHIHLSETQIEALALLAAMSGSTIYTSDPVHEIGESRRKLLDLIRPDHVVDASFPEWQNLDDMKLIVNRTKDGTLVYWFNPTDIERIATPDWTAFAGESAAYVWQYHGSGHSVKEVPYVRVAPRSCALFFVSDRELTSEPGNLWNWQEKK